MLLMCADTAGISSTSVISEESGFDDCEWSGLFWELLEEVGIRRGSESLMTSVLSRIGVGSKTSMSSFGILTGREHISQADNFNINDKIT